ncbi:MAG: alpha/beta hydrolase [Bacteroidetes bacterium]|nr:alpha/beta hydrolase [Bacteroidota bacterium]
MGLHFSDLGQGMPVVLIHGYPLSHEIWQKQHSLQNQFRLLIPDLPGFGRSPAQPLDSLYEYGRILMAWLDSLSIKQAVFVGHSMGGYLTLAMLEQHRERFVGAGLVCSQAGADSEDARDARFKTIDRVREEGTSFIPDLMLGKLFAASQPGKQSPESSNVSAIMRGASESGVVSALKSMAARKDQIDLLRTTPVPMLFIAGKQDQLISPEKSYEMKKANPGAFYCEIEDAGHMAMMEQPASVNVALREFISSL